MKKIIKTIEFDKLTDLVGSLRALGNDQIFNEQGTENSFSISLKLCLVHTNKQKFETIRIITNLFPMQKRLL